MDNFNAFQMHESIYQKGITAELSFFDAYDYLTLIPIVGGETIRITLSDDTNQFSDEFVVVERASITNREGTGMNDIMLKLVQKTYYDIITRNFPKGVYGKTDTINSIIDTILNTNNPNISLSKSSIVVPNKIKLSSFPIRYTMDEIFHYLIEKNGLIDNGKIYMIYDRHESKFKLISDKSMSQAISKGFFSFSDKYGDRVENYISKFVTHPGLSIKNLNTMAMLYSHTYNLDTNTKKLQTNKSSFNTFMDKYNQKFSSISEETFNHNNGESNFWSYIPFLYENDLEVSYINRASNHFRRSISHTITTAGKLDMMLGDKISPLFKKAFDGMDSYSTLQGDYIITSIVHKFQSDAVYVQDMTISKSEIESSDKYKTRLIERRVK
jgi:hypothetical protein